MNRFEFPKQNIPAAETEGDVTIGGGGVAPAGRGGNLSIAFIPSLRGPPITAFPTCRIKPPNSKLFMEDTAVLAEDSSSNSMNLEIIKADKKKVKYISKIKNLLYPFQS